MNTNVDFLAKFFPQFLGDASGIAQMIFPMLLGKDEGDTKAFARKTSGLKTDIRLNSMSVPNAYTYPGVSTTGMAQLQVLTNLIPGGGLIAGNLISLMMMKKLYSASLSGRAGKNGRVIFSSPPRFSLMMVQTKGLKSKLTPEQRFGVQLHEIGHWVEYPKIMSSRGWSMLSLLSLLAFPAIMADDPLQSHLPAGMEEIPLKIRLAVYGSLLGVIFFSSSVLGALASRTAEMQADEFVKSVGHADNLIGAFKVFDDLGHPYRNKIPSSGYGRARQKIEAMSSQIEELMDSIIPLATHPSLIKRMKALASTNEETMTEDLSDIKIFVMEKAKDLVKVVMGKIDAGLAALGKIFITKGS